MNIYAISNAQGQTYNRFDMNKKLEDLGIPSDVIAKGQSAIQKYASENQITLPVSEKKETQAEQPQAAVSNVQPPPPPNGKGAQLDKLA